MFDTAADASGDEPKRDAMPTMGFLDHLEELRRRLVFSIAAVAVGFFACWWKVERIYDVMQRPIMDALKANGMPERLVYLNPTEPFNLYLKIAALAGLFLTSPFVLYQVWMFISPGLYRNEKRYVVPFMISTIALFTSRWWQTDYPKLSQTADRSLFRLSIIAVISVYVQLILGALMRHTGSGLAVPDFPLAYGQIFPSLSPESVARYNQDLIDSNLRLFADGAVTSSQIFIHMLHRMWAVVVAVMVVALSVKLLKAKQLPAQIKRFAYVLISLIVVQLVLGMFTIFSQKAVDITTAHVATGALILVTSVLLLMHLARIYQVQVKKFSFVYSTERAIA